jgi:hypothetical protein
MKGVSIERIRCHTDQDAYNSNSVSVLGFKGMYATIIHYSSHYFQRTDFLLDLEWYVYIPWM